MYRIVIVGAGINGVTAAIELKKRGHKISLLDPGPLPHPLAASTDISKAVRAAYGNDEDYTALAERSIKLWREWNEKFGVELYHEVAFLFLRQRAMRPADFEYESFELLRKRGHKVERIDSRTLRKRFPAWNAERYPDGFIDMDAGYAESGRVVSQLIAYAQSIGIELRENCRFGSLEQRDDRVSSVLLQNGESLPADKIVLTVGAWTPYLLPWTNRANQNCSSLRDFRFLGRIFPRLATTVFRSGAKVWSKSRTTDRAAKCRPNLLSVPSPPKKKGRCANFSRRVCRRWPTRQSSTRESVCIAIHTTAIFGLPPTQNAPD
jgi:glycine/D-amino acid oxidase-like deaminating enzyme